MKQEIVPINSIEHVTPEILELTFHSDHLSSVAKPGHFINIRVDENFPLLRRPFSIFNVNGKFISIIFNVIGTGTKVLAKKKIGETIDVVGPCGNDFLPFLEGTYDTAFFVAGGIGVAPFPFMTKHATPKKQFITFVGGRNKNLIVRKGLHRPKIATDDGSEGFHGTVLDLIKHEMAEKQYGKIRFFLCGPTRMMKAVSEYAKDINADCYASLETDMACGIGLCQGCNVETTAGERKYKLVCREGTIFDTRTVKF